MCIRLCQGGGLQPAGRPALQWLHPNDIELWKSGGILLKLDIVAAVGQVARPMTPFPSLFKLHTQEAEMWPHLWQVALDQALSWQVMALQPDLDCSGVSLGSLSYPHAPSP